MGRTFGFVLAVSIALIGAACSDDDGVDVSANGSSTSTSAPVSSSPSAVPPTTVNGPSQPATSPDGQWMLVGFTADGGDVSIPPDATVELDIEAGEAGGFSGCNSFGGTLDVTADGSFAIRDVFVTEMACADPRVMDFEGGFLEALGATTDWAIAGDQLVLTGPSAELRFAARPPVVEAPLLGTEWQLDTFYDGDSGDDSAASNSSAMDGISLELEEDLARWRAPCWSIEGAAMAEPGGEGSLAIDFSASEPAFTCEPRPLLDEILTRSADVTAYRIDGTRLFLADGDRLLLGFRAADG